MAKQSALTIPGDAALLYEILTDYDHLAEWLPQVSKSRLLAREGELALAELELRGKRARRLAMECIHSRDRMIVWRPIEGGGSVTEFQWTLEPAGDGQCRVTAKATRRISKSRLLSRSGELPQPRLCLEALKNQALCFVPPDKLAKGWEEILEIVETESGLICRLRGRKYRLVPETE
jgi:ribosome-associated toxin RatA of RatAB toxin-antitoxin module